MKGPAEHIEELIARYLQGLCTPEEELELQAWRDADTENEDWYRDAEFLFYATASVSQEKTFDTEAAWQKVVPQLQKPRQIWMTPGRWMAAAAALVLLSALGWILRLQLVDQPFESLAVDHDLEIVLPDQSKLTLTKGSRIEALYPESSGKREYRLEGEARFDLAAGESPFILHSGPMEVHDIGTIFRVKAREALDTAWVEVEAGEVELRSSGAESLHLKAGESGYYLRNRNKFERRSALPHIKLQSFVFEDRRLTDVAAILSASFGEEIILDNPALSSCSISVTFRQENLEVMLDIITSTLGLEWKKKGNSYHISGGACLD